MDLGTPACYPNKSFPNFMSADLTPPICPEGENFADTKSAEPVAAFVDEAWAPVNAFLDAMQEAVSGVDEYLCVKYWNMPMARLTGVAREEALHRPIFSLLPRDFERHLEAGLRQLFHHRTNGDDAEERCPVAVEGEFSQRHGNRNFLDFFYRMRFLPTNGNCGVAILSLRPAGESRRQRRQNPPGALGLLGNLSAGIAQEISNPLDAICSRIDNILTLAGNDWDSRLESELHSIITEVYRLSYFVNNLVSLASSGASYSAQVDINHLVPEAITFLEHTLNRKIACATALQEGLPPVWGDPILLQTVLQNILRYAVEAAGEDAVPRIQTSWMESSQYLDQPPNGHARSNSSKPRAGKKPAPLIVLRIEERGPQITPEVLAQLFEPMASCKRFGIAVGLGLFITKKIIESHRGQLTVTSGPNRGTIFTIALRALPLPA